MHSIIDVPQNVGGLARYLAASGVNTVIRYYNHRNSTLFPSKCLTGVELAALHGAGMSVAVAFEQRGGAGGRICDLDGPAGERDSARALDLAATLHQPKGSAIYFTVDWDYYAPQHLTLVTSYFRSVRDALAGCYLVGVYGSGTVGRHLKLQGLVDHIWLSGSLEWSGTRQALEQGDWSLFQRYMGKRSAFGGFRYDGNLVNPALQDFGQFGPPGRKLDCVAAKRFPAA